MQYCLFIYLFAYLQNGTEEAEDKTRSWQLPWVPPPTEEPPSEEEIARKAAIKEKQGQRLREMAEAKRSSRINELENESHGLEFLLKQLEQVEEHDIQSFLSATGYVSKKEVESALVKVTQSLLKAKGEQAEFEEKPDAERFHLLNKPDHECTPDEVCLCAMYLSHSPSFWNCCLLHLESIICIICTLFIVLSTLLCIQIP